MSDQNDPAARVPARPAPQRNPVRDDLARLEAASTPWWAQAPRVAAICVAALVAPVRALVLAAEAAVSLAFVGLFGTVALWWFGHIGDETAASFLASAGERVLALFKASGAI